eukprot:1087737-Alexandrium_andersonii.AAC.1
MAGRAEPGRHFDHGCQPGADRPAYGVHESTLGGGPCQVGADAGRLQLVWLGGIQPPVRIRQTWLSSGAL